MKSATHGPLLPLAGLGLACLITLAACNQAPVPVTGGDDTEAPVVTSFTVTSANPTGDRAISVSLSGTDNRAITGWMIKETADDPDDGDSGWAASTPTSYTISDGYGVKTLYAWAKDAGGNVSVKKSVTVTYQNTSATLKRVIIWSSGPDGVLGTADDVMTGYGKMVVAGNETFQISYTGIGPDGTWFTDDDVATSSYAKMIQFPDGSMAMAFYNGAGPDGQWYTADDTMGTTSITRIVPLSASSGLNIISREAWLHTGAGPDGQWFTADDIISGYGWLQNDAAGDPQYAWQSGNKGPDGQWGTADDTIVSCMHLVLDEHNRIVTATTYNAAGPDGNWTTPADNKVSMAYQNTYDSAGRNVRQVMQFAGADGILGNGDDSRSAMMIAYADDGTIQYVKGSSNPGADGQWFTADDTITSYMTYAY